MNALDVLRVLRRHPFVLTLLLLLSVAGAGAVYKELPVNYQSSASQILLPSNLVTTVNGKTQITTKVNPYRFTGDNSSQITASTLVTAANGSSFQRALTADGVVSTPSVAISAAGGGVVIDVATTAKQPADTSRDLRKVLTALDNQLYNQQERAGAPENQFYALGPVNSPDAPVQVTSGRFKTAVISGVLGVIVTLIIVLIYDGQVRRRPRGRRRTDRAGRGRQVFETDEPATPEPASGPGPRRRRDDRHAGPTPGRGGSGGSQQAGRVTVADRDVVGPRAR